MQKIIRGNKGFTLSELAVALSVGAIVLAMLALSVFYLHKAFYTSDYVNNSLAEYNGCKAQINELVADWNKQGYTKEVVSEQSIAVKNAGDIVHNLQTKDNVLMLDSKEVLTFNYISALIFVKQDNLTIVQVVFTNNEQMQFIV